MALAQEPPFLPSWTKARRKARWPHDPQEWERWKPKPEPYGAGAKHFDRLAKRQEMEEHAQRQEQKKYLELAIFARPEQLEQARGRQEERKARRASKQAEEIKAKQMDPRLRQVLHCVAIRRAILAEDARALRIAFKDADPLLMHNLTRDSAGLREQMEKGAEGAQKAFVSAVKARIDQEKELVEALGIELEDGRRMRRGETLSKARMAQLHAQLLK